MNHVYFKRKEVLSREKGPKGCRGKKNIVLFYPNTYQIGISSLAFHRIWELSKRFGEIGVIRYFLEDNGEKEIFPLDDKLEVSEVSAFAFFLSYENDYFNVVKALEKLNIPIFSKERKDLPLVVAGGVAITDNPEPLAEIFDAIFIGEAEESFENFVNIILNTSSKKEIMDHLEKIESVYLPDKVNFEYDSDGIITKIFGRKVKRGIYSNFTSDFSKSQWVTEKSEFSNTFLIELTRGCPAKCKFCISRTLYRPLRFASFEKIKEVILQNKEIQKFGLLGASVSYHPDIKKIMNFLISLNKEFSLSSLRADLLDDEFIELLKKGGIKTLTIAPEAGSDNLRKLIDKGIEIEDIERAIKLALNKEIENLKMYFMIGLPYETMNDIESIVDIAGLVRHIEKKERKRFKKVSFTLSPFVPKPFTPLQWAFFADMSETNNKIRYLRKKLHEKGVTVLYDLPKWARIQAILSRGDRKVVNFLLKSIGDKNFTQLNINPAFYAERERGTNEFFPWDFIDAGINKDELLKQWLVYKEKATKLE